MCLFFRDFVQDCGHSECQIFSTIKSLNQRTISREMWARHSQSVLLKNMDSLTNLVPDEQKAEAVYKVEEQEPASIEQQWARDSEGEGACRERVDYLELEVRELKELTHWLGSELYKKVILP